MNRIGLVQLNDSARNSPFGLEKASSLTKPLDPSSAPKKTIPEPLKLKQTYSGTSINSSLNHSKIITPVTSPFDVFCDDAEIKENRETQTLVEKCSMETQTTITVPHIQPKLTSEDLCSEKPTVNYLRCMADRLQMDLEGQMERNEELVRLLGDLDESMTKMDEDMEILLEVLQDIDDEQMDNETGETHV